MYAQDDIALEFNNLDNRSFSLVFLHKKWSII